MWAKIRTTAWEIIKFVIVVLVIVIPIRTYIAQPFVVSGASMYPTFDNSEYLIVDEISYRFQEPARGDVIVFEYPRDHRLHFIKRIIGLPGEIVKIQGDKVSIDDGVKKFDLVENYVTEAFNANFETKLLPGEYFVMGDNRSVSLDSRAWGPLTRDLITGRVIFRLFPPNKINYLPGHEKIQSDSRN